MAEASARAGRFHWLTRHIPTRETIHEYRLLRPFARSLTSSVAVAADPAIGSARGRGRSVRRRDHPVHAHGHRGAPRDSGASQCRRRGALSPWSSIRSRSRSCIWPPTGSARGSSTTTRPWSTRPTRQRFSSELSRLLFWIHHASGPIALGILTHSPSQRRLIRRLCSHRGAGAGASGSAATAGASARRPRKR